VAEQFVESHRLPLDPRLAVEVDKALESVFKDAAAYDSKPGAARFASLVWGAHVAGELISRHFQARAEQLEWLQPDQKSGGALRLVPLEVRGRRASNYECFAKGLYSALEALLISAGGPLDAYDRELRVAVSGAYAARLHLGAKSKLPVPFLELVIYCGSADQAKITEGPRDRVAVQKSTRPGN
jgi:hypothetical protein